MDWVYLLIIIMVSYIIGSIPTGYLMVKQIKGIDIRTVGSGSTGATNVKRILGSKFFFIVMFLDMLKGLIPLICLKFVNYVPPMLSDIFILNIIVGIILVVGHSKSIFIGFKGGKSVATGTGVLFGLCWPVASCAFLIWSVVVYFSKYVSLGSIIASLSTPVLMLCFKQPMSYIIFTVFIALYISFYLHRENLARLLSGKENKISFKGDNK